MIAAGETGPVVITIARQMGAGGSEIGQRLARDLNCAYLDKQLLTEAASRLHHAARDVEPMEEHAPSLTERNGFWAGLGNAFLYGPVWDDAVAYSKDLFSAQRDIICETASRGPAVIVGRAAHWVLRDHPHLFSMFLHAPPETRAQRIQRLLALDDLREARVLTSRADQKRAGFSEWVTGLPWEQASQYHLCLDSGRLGFELTYRLVLATAKRYAEAHEGGNPWL